MSIEQLLVSEDATGLAHHVARGDVSPAELLEAALARAHRLNPRLNAIVRFMEGEARATLSGGLPDGPFAGVPFLIKDAEVTYAGVETSNGSEIFRGVVPDSDSEIVRRLKKAGTVIFGKTSTSELALGASTESRRFGPTRNPYDLTRSAGGSSGGAAAAVAARIVPVAQGSDGGGSIRIPASCCGLVGLKPTRGRVPYGPRIAEGWAGLSVIHVLTRSVRDSAGFLDALAGPMEGDPYVAPPPEIPFAEEVGRAPGRLRIGVSAVSPFGTPVDAECVRAVTKTAQLCESLGHHVEETEIPYEAAWVREAFPIINGVHSRLTLERCGTLRGAPVREDEVERITWVVAERGRKAMATDYARAVQSMHACGRVVARFFTRYDLLLTPVLGAPPLPLGALDPMTEDLRAYGRVQAQWLPFTMLANLAGAPAISLPLHTTQEGLPVGVQLMAPYGGDGLLLRLASALEAAAPWAERAPREVL